MKKDWYKIVNKSPDVADVLIYDEIGMWGVSAKRFVEQFNGITAKKINLRINSVGGAVFDGFAIYNAVKAHAATVNVFVDGLAASISSVIALAGDTVTIAKNAYMMIHKPWSMAAGDADSLRKEAALLDKLCETIAMTYCEKTGKTLAEMQKCMADETWFDATEAKAFGLADAIGEDDGDDTEPDADPDDKAALLVKASLKYRNAPESLRRIAASLNKPTPRKEDMAAPLISREGKFFVNVGGVELEVNVVGSPTANAQVASPAAKPIDIEAAKTEAVATERAYRKEFSACLAIATLDAKAAADFETKFYGRPIEDVKFLASNAIGTRAKPVGEGSGEGEKTPADAEAVKNADSDKAHRARWDSEPGLRRMYGCDSSDKSNAKYTAGLDRYLAREHQWAEDQKPENQRKMIARTK